MPSPHPEAHHEAWHLGAVDPIAGFELACWAEFLTELVCIVSVWLLPLVR